jgi:hypothetical protein
MHRKIKATGPLMRRGLLFLVTYRKNLGGQISKGTHYLRRRASDSTNFSGSTGALKGLARAHAFQVTRTKVELLA